MVGKMMQHGKVIYSPETLNSFRNHHVTSRARTKIGRSQAEFIITKYRLFQRSGLPSSSFPALIEPDITRFLHENASWSEVLKELFNISIMDTLKCATLLLRLSCQNPKYINKFSELYQLSRIHKKT
jgi:hypothetical protein